MFSERVYKTIADYADEYYPILKIWLPSCAYVFIRHPDDMNEILSSRVNIDKGPLYDNMRYCGNDGIVFSGGQKWYHRRKLLNPAFSPSMLRFNTGIIGEHAEKFVQYLGSQGDESVQELVPLLTRITMNLICETTMGINLEESTIEGAELFREALDFAFDVTAFRHLNPYITDFMMNFLPIGRKQTRLLKVGRTFSSKVIENRRKYFEKIGYKGLRESITNDEIETHTGHEGRRGLSVIDILLSAEKDGLIDSKGVADEVETFIAAGYDTSAMTLAYLLLLLSEHQDVQASARAEAKEILTQCGGKLTLDDTKKMVYMERCIKESMRIQPTVPRIDRILKKEAKLSGYIVPPKTEVVLLIHETHRDPKFWLSPEKFDPDRFLPENTKSRHPFAYIPFSAGPRQCIGYKYAMITMKVLVSAILNKFKLEPVQRIADLDFHVTLVSKPTVPVFLKFIKIDQNS
ncbi:hypothetical protein QAD02_022789 [Eretmocerus hayati]|uniref:Uncharacterized protein n=1 Tax=Eretmocerus hayati TaxID=131215 RepID=A0ACC2PTT3_9HYME|nr:hypothetical protein QAD02_022789 [Eretmocerus hayati]